MSGGAFDYQQYKLGQIADIIETRIENNDSDELNQYGDRIGYGFDAEVIAEFRNAVRALKLAQVYAQRVDWLLSGDDGPESFKTRLDKELRALLMGAE